MPLARPLKRHAFRPSSKCTANAPSFCLIHALKRYCFLSPQRPILDSAEPTERFYGQTECGHGRAARDLWRIKRQSVAGPPSIGGGNFQRTRVGDVERGSELDQAQRDILNGQQFLLASDSPDPSDCHTDVYWEVL